jgi:predicted aminopeptidase
VFSYQRISWRWIRRGLGALAVIVLGYLFLAPTGRYLLHAAWAEGHILANRRSIVDLVADSTTKPAIARRLRLVLAARSFAAESIGLTTRQSFTTFSQLDRDTLVLVLSGAYRDRLASYTWWFPIVGRVPYKGYFDFHAARAAAQKLDGQGFDVYLRPSPAFSTLGWFNDPLLSTSLGADTLDLANTVIHELTHNTFYASGQAEFNESFASFVGARGSAWLFRSRGDSAAADEADARWSDEKLLARFWATLYQSVDSAFRAHPTDSLGRLAARDTLYVRARRELVDVLGPRFRTIGPRSLERMRIDNAALLARRVYATDLDLFDAAWARSHGDLRRAVEQIIALAKSQPGNPFGALANAAAAAAATPSSADSAAKPPAQ